VAQAVAKVKTGTKTRFAFLRRLSVVFAFELRIRIVTELYLREMSAKEFFEEFGGGSLSRVNKHFVRLAEEGWLTYIRTETGGRRRGAREHFYRAPELAVFDSPTWALVPYSLRVAISWRTFKILADRVRDALVAGTLDAHAGSHLSHTTMLLDRLGWERAIAATDTLFEAIFAEQSEAKLRMTRTGEEPMRATVALAAFESPAPPRGSRGRRIRPRLVHVGKDSLIPFPVRVSKAIGDELSLKILAVANLREVSAPQFHAEFGGDTVIGIRRRFKRLEKSGWLVKVGQKSGGRRRGATEYFYRATGPAIFRKESWAELPDSIEPTESWTNFKQLGDLVKQAIMAGTLEARPESHLSWSVMRLDRRGWERVAAAIEAVFALIYKEWEAAEARLAESGEAPIATTVALAAFESPPTAVKEP
jgi:hypothetical protein